MANKRILIVGAGFWGKEWSKVIMESSDLDLVGVVTKENPTPQEAAKELGLNLDIFFEDFHKAINQTEADIVVVVAPPNLHLPVTEAALKAKKHVICEKPLADTWENGVEISRIVKAYPDQKFMVSQTRRYVPHVQAIRKFISQGQLGQVNYINFDHSVYDPDNYGWRLKLYSVVLEDMSIHHFDLFRYITGQEPVSVFAEGWMPSWSQYPNKVCHNVLIEMTEDIHINYFATWTARGRKNGYDGIMEIVGEKGSLSLVDNNTLLFYPSADPEPPEDSPEPVKVPIDPVENQEIKGILEAFLDALKNNVTPPCNVDDNLKTLAMLCAALKSCKTDKRVNIEEMLSEL